MYFFFFYIICLSNCPNVRLNLIILSIILYPHVCSHSVTYHVVSQNLLNIVSCKVPKGTATCRKTSAYGTEASYLLYKYLLNKKKKKKKKIFTEGIKDSITCMVDGFTLSKSSSNVIGV